MISGRIRSATHRNQHNKQSSRQRKREAPAKSNADLTVPTCACVTQRKQHRPGIASNENTMHVKTARSSADLTKLNLTPTPQYTLAKDTIIHETDT